jgi:hypothetical protein
LSNTIKRDWPKVPTNNGFEHGPCRVLKIFIFFGIQPNEAKSVFHLCGFVFWMAVTPPAVMMKWAQYAEAGLVWIVIATVVCIMALGAWLWPHLGFNAGKRASVMFPSIARNFAVE